MVFAVHDDTELVEVVLTTLVKNYRTIMATYCNRHMKRQPTIVYENGATVYQLA